MKKTATKLLALLLTLLTISSTAFALTAAAVTEKAAKKPEITISSEHLSVTKGKRIQLTATVTGVDTEPEITWTTSDSKIATVNAKGKVKGVNTGKVVITASATVNGETISAEYRLNVVKSSNLVNDLLERYQLLSYQYSYVDDYYYTNDKQAWQYNFGYGPIYDIAAPYILLEYDYVRVFFTYEDKDWMIQLWKGQYGLIFYGSEIGIYNKEHNGKPDNLLTFYSCPPEEDWAKMRMTLYHQELNGSYTREFTRPYDTYWWCTGFKEGHLRIEEPADELRMNSVITLKDAEMAKLFADGLVECGFTQVSDKKNIGTDQFCLEGANVHIQWQDINEAENTMPIKVGAGVIIATNILSTIMATLSFFSIIGLGALIFI